MQGFADHIRLITVREWIKCLQEMDCRLLSYRRSPTIGAKVGDIRTDSRRPSRVIYKCIYIVLIINAMRYF